MRHAKRYLDQLENEVAVFCASGRYDDCLTDFRRPSLSSRLNRRKNRELSSQKYRSGSNPDFRSHYPLQEHRQKTSHREVNVRPTRTHELGLQEVPAFRVATISECQPGRRADAVAKM